MKYSMLGGSGVEVSRVCLGTMTWGMQNNQAEADEQIEFALSRGVNFVDTAEMYAVPPTADTYGTTETIIGNWLARNAHRRSEIILATKIAGNGLPWIRGGADITGEAIVASVDASLKRLQTDYIDLYQLHWPNRTSPHFGKHWVNDIGFSRTDLMKEREQMLEILQALNSCVNAGKVRYCGLSDDTTWGVAEYLRLSEKYALPRMVSIQNEFNLLQTKDWPHLIEHCVHENVAYLPWSPLASGALSGKYIDGAMPTGSRWSLLGARHNFRKTDNVNAAVKSYANIAKELGMTTAQLALAWCDSVEGVTSTIIGATSMAQLKENLDAFEIQLTDDARRAVAAVLKQFPVPF